MSQQQSQTTATGVQTPTTSKCQHPEAVGKRWGDPISEERQAELQGYLDRWAAETDHGERKGPFDRRPHSAGVSLTGADVSWLATQSGRNRLGRVPNLHLEGTNLEWAHLEGSDLSQAHMAGAALERAQLKGANLSYTHLEGADLLGAQLEGANLAPFLGGRVLYRVRLDSAVLRAAHLERASLPMAQLEGADLQGAHLDGASLQKAQLRGANLLNAWMDKATRLNDANLDRASLDQISFGGANLAVIKWESVTILGDEVRARDTKFGQFDSWPQGHRKARQDRLDDYEAAVRAHLQLAAVMRSQGMRDQADRFSYRAQVLQRGVLRYRLHFGAAFGSWFLDLISGYGYRPIRSFITYVLVILAFAAAYFALGGANGQALSWNEAIVISMTAFHGRGFFSAVFQPGDVQAAVAAVEAFIGLLIEIVFIATFTQRFFAR